MKMNIEKKAKTNSKNEMRMNMKKVKMNMKKKMSMKITIIIMNIYKLLRNNVLVSLLIY
jgi:hypothetical protein